MKNRMEELYDLIKEYNHEYYVNNISKISDFEYDKLFKELKDLEGKYPQYVIENSPINNVDDNVDNRFVKVVHQIPMLSLDNAFDENDLRKFDADIKKEFSDFTYVCELKIDGLAMSFIYEDNKFTRAVTRGNGSVGEDVTHNVLTINSLVKNVDKAVMEVRGEVFVSKDEFRRLNDVQTSLGQKVFANPRNLASGTIRQLDSEIAKSRNLDAFIYSEVNPTTSSHYESLTNLKKLGFNVNSHIKKVGNIDEVIEYVKYWDSNRHNLDYETDGIVIKVNEYDIQKALGFNSRAPKWAIAYKYKAEQVETKILGITYQVGRTGKITPVAELESVSVSGSVVSRATLHNENYIIEKDIHVGDVVLVHKAGEIIPEVVEVVKEKRSDITDFVMISNCPICDSVLEKDEANYYCTNPLCAAKLSRNIIYFASISAMNIEGLGERNVEIFFEKGFVKNIVDLYELKNHREQLIQLEGFGERRVDLILENIEKSKSNKLEQFITGLGIKHVGKKISSILVNHFGSIDGLIAASFEELVAIDEVGDAIANSLMLYFESDDFKQLYNYILHNNFNFQVEKIDNSSEYANKVVCVTGSFAIYKRKDIEQFFKLQGAKVSSSVSKNTDYLIKGEKAGSKLEKAIQFGVEIIDEEKLNKIMEGKHE